MDGFTFQNLMRQQMIDDGSDRRPVVVLRQCAMQVCGCLFQKLHALLSSFNERSRLPCQLPLVARIVDAYETAQAANADAAQLPSLLKPAAAKNVRKK